MLYRYLTEINMKYQEFSSKKWVTVGYLSIESAIGSFFLNFYGFTLEKLGKANYIKEY